MKIYDYLIAQSLNIITGIIFFSQLIIEVGGLITRKPGFEWILPFCGGTFLLSVFYSLALVLLNAKARHNKEINRT